MKRIVSIALAALLMGACAQDKTEDIGLDGKKIYASIESTDTAGRVLLNEQKQTVWTAGDQIWAIHRTEGLTAWQFDGQTGDRSGSFSYMGSLNYDLSAYENLNEYYAFYPLSALYTYGALPNNRMVLIGVLQPEWDYLPNSYGLHANTMLGTSTDGENYTFKNLHGYLRISLTGTKKVKSVRLEGNNGDYLAGYHYFALDNIDEWRWYEPVALYQQINCGDEGVQLSATPTDFYYVLPPMTLSKGITVTVTFTDETTYTKRTAKSIPIERNTIQPMAAFDTSGDNFPQRILLYHTGTTVAGPMLGGASSMAAQIDWGDGYISLLNQLTSYDYTDEQPSHTITVKATDAVVVQLEKCTGITKIDLSNF